MSEAGEAKGAETETGAEALGSLLRRLRRAAPLVGWLFGVGVGLPAYQRGDLLDAALRGGAVWALAVVVWTVGLTVCERLLVTEAEEASGSTPSAVLTDGGKAPTSPTASK